MTEDCVAAEAERWSAAKVSTNHTRALLCAEAPVLRLCRRRPTPSLTETALMLAALPSYAVEIVEYLWGELRTVVSTVLGAISSGVHQHA